MGVFDRPAAQLGSSILIVRCCVPQMLPTASSVLLPGAVGSMERKRSAEAAAAARRKRRKALVRRHQQVGGSSVGVPSEGDGVLSLCSGLWFVCMNSVSHGCISFCDFQPKHHENPSLTPIRVSVVQPTVDGVTEVATRWNNGEMVAIPTECTYETYFRLDSDRSRKRLLQRSTHLTPYLLYAPDSHFLRELFPHRTYALRNNDGEASVVHRFNESTELLKRLAPRLWPGPLTIHVACDANLVDSSLLVRHESVSYVALRSPCHPLARRVTQEYARSHPSSALVGFPVFHEDFLLSAQAVAEGSFKNPPSAVLNGEERAEVFAVPTCEHQQPWSVTLLVDERIRQVRLVGPTSSTTLTRDGLKQAMRDFKPKTVQDCMIHTVLSKWTVREED